MAGPDLESLYQAAMAEHRAGRLDVAIACYQQVLDRDRHFARAWHLLGVALHQQGDTARAIEYVQRAIGLEPQRAVFYNNLGSIYVSVGRSRDAEPVLRRAIELSPASSAALVMLGNVLSEQNRCDEAVPVFERALAVNPRDAEAFSGLGLAYSELGHVESSIAAYKQAHEVSGEPIFRIVATIQLPLVYESAGDVLRWRQRLNDQLDALLAAGRHGRHLRIRAAPDLQPAAPGSERPRNPAQVHAAVSQPRRFRRTSGSRGSWKNSRRLSFPAISASTRSASSSAGSSSHLSRDDFHVTLFSVGQHDDPVARELAASADRYVVLPRDLPLARRTILENSVDVLVYHRHRHGRDDLHARLLALAPVQCTTWGHPETTGLATIDYFVSSDLMEMPEADAHYSEKLVRLPSLTLCFPSPRFARRMLACGPRQHSASIPPPRSTLARSRSTSSIPTSMPHWPASCVAIPKGKIVLIQWAYAEADELLRRRFARTMPDVADRIVFIRRLQQPEFMKFLTLVDVLLDPFPYGGGNSSLEAFSFGVPVVTLPTEFLRGRITPALCRRLGLEQCIAKCLDDYVRIAVNLGTDAAFRRWSASKSPSASRHSSRTGAASKIGSSSCGPR